MKVCKLSAFVSTHAHLVDAHGLGIFKKLFDGIPAGPRGGALRPAVVVVEPIVAVAVVVALAFPFRVAAGRGGARRWGRVLYDKRRVTIVPETLVATAEEVPRPPAIKRLGSDE